MISFKYSSLESLSNDFNHLFSNCIIYWRKYNAQAGSRYIHAAEHLKQNVETILSQLQSTLPDLAKAVLDTIAKEQQERKQKQLERKQQQQQERKMMDHYQAYVSENTLPPVPLTVTPWMVEQDYTPAISVTSSAPLTRTHSRKINSYGDVAYGGPR